MYKIPVLVEEKEFFEFINGVFAASVAEFNGACGKNPHTVTDVDDAVDMVLNECDRVIEESEEAIAAYRQRNRKERLDGIVDVYWTVTQLDNLMNVFTEKFGAEFSETLKLRDFDDVLKVAYASSQSKLGIQLAQGTIISGEAIIHAALRVMENNKMKYTDDKDVAEDWRANMDKKHVGLHFLKSYEYQGKTYYCIKRKSDDYIVKPYNFKSVDLGGL